MVVTEEELRSRLHLFDIVLQRLVASSPLCKANLEATLQQVEATLGAVDARSLHAVWYIDLLLEWKEKLTEYRFVLSHGRRPETGTGTGDSKAPWKKAPPTAGSKNEAKEIQSEDKSSTELPVISGASKLSADAAEFKPRSRVSPSSTNSSGTSASDRSSLLATPSPVTYYPSPPRLIAPLLLRYEVCCALAFFPAVTDPHNHALLNGLFNLIAHTTKLIFPFIGDAHFTSDIFRLLFAKCPPLVQARFRDAALPGTLQNLLAFLRHFTQGVLMKRRHELAALNAQMVGVVGGRFCSFCKCTTNHNIVSCGERQTTLCYRCFTYGHSARHCTNPPLLDANWLNSGQLTYQDPLNALY